MQQTLYEFETEPEQRPSFLTWLCILTFIGSGWAIISCIWTYATAGKTNFVYHERMQKRDSVLKSDTVSFRNKKETHLDQKVQQSFSKILNTDNLRKVAIGGFIASLLTLAGAILMWNLKRKGFYIYILGVALGIAIPFYLYGNDLIAVGATSFANFFGLVFIALYALNLKSMQSPKKGF